MKSFSARVLAVVALLSLIANVLLYMRYSTNRPLVTVGSETITKKQYLDQLEHQAGQDVLTKMVLNKLVMQAAVREGVVPTSQDVEDRIQSIERRAPQLLSPYSQDAGKMAEFRQQLTTTLALENLRIKDVNLTRAEVAAFYNKHQAEFVLPQQVKTTTVVTRNAVDAATAADLLRRNEPPDVIGRQPRLSVVGVNGYNPDLQALPLALKRQVGSFVQKASVGDIKTFRNGPFFMTFAVTKNNGASVPSLTQISDQVDHMARLASAPSPQEELARLYQAAKPTFRYDPDKYSAYLAPIQKYPMGQDNGQKSASVP